MKTKKTVKCENCDATLTNYFSKKELKELEKEFIKEGYDFFVGDITRDAANQLEEYFEKYNNFDDQKYLEIKREIDTQADHTGRYCEFKDHIIISFKLTNL